ncbi:MAG TPA: response regulator transcription factor [Candidatus Dormibacteraeota bacterium]|jgi:DNA-binding NarL/FixJ family response regulator
MATMTTTDRIRIAVHADDAISRAGLLAQLRHRPELLLTDDGCDAAVVVVLADEVDAATLRTIRACRRTTAAQVVLIASRLDDDALLAAVEAGAVSLLLRAAASVGAVIEAVRVAEQGSGSMPPELLGRLLDRVGRLQRDVLEPRGLRVSGLTERETKVLRLIAEGYDTVEVGRRLFYSDRTVKNIVHDITTRLHLRNRVHAVAYALRQGLI